MQASNETFDWAESPVPFVLGGYPLISQSETILSGQNIAAGAVLGKVTASGKYVLSLSGSSDGSQTPIAIAAVAIDASSADLAGPVFVSGLFDSNLLTYGTAHTAATVKDAFAGSPLFVENTLTLQS